MDWKTVECVSPAHPDKICDQISDSILDACLTEDPQSRVAVETMGGHGKVYITGEITTTATVDFAEHARKILKATRYNPDKYEIITNIAQQSPDIAQGVDTGGAGDQGIMVGYATRETKEYIPYELQEARAILKGLWDNFDATRDAKSQVTTNNGKIQTIVVSAERLKNTQIEAFLDERYGKKYGDTTAIKYLINPAGERESGGFQSDAGLTGRKLAVDNYGPQIEIGGGAFSGKDPTKVDRSGAYIARKIAVQYLQNNANIQRVKTKLAYAIGYQNPVMVSIQTDQGMQDYQGPIITPQYIIETLDLLQPIYTQTAKRGHFGNGFVWDA